MNSDPLRTCRVCGVTANTVEELSKFADAAKSKFGKDTLCRGCFNEQNRVSGKYGKRRQKYTRAYIKKRFRFKGNLMRTQVNPRTNICSKCGAKYPEQLKQQTCLHHEKYDPSDLLSHTVELCHSCHMQLHSDRNDVVRLEGRKIILPKGKGIIRNKNEKFS